VSRIGKAINRILAFATWGSADGPDRVFLEDTSFRVHRPEIDAIFRISTLP
jgi:hypothetical protein